MSSKAVEQFRDKMNTDPVFQREAEVALNASVPAVVALGARNGMDFTEAEASTAISSSLKDGELSDFELELVSAGGSCPTDQSASGHSDVSGS